MSCTRFCAFGFQRGKFGAARSIAPSPVVAALARAMAIFAFEVVGQRGVKRALLTREMKAGDGLDMGNALSRLQACCGDAALA